MSEDPRVLPPVYFLGALVGMAALHAAIPIAEFITTPYRHLGIVVVALGFWIVVWAAYLFKRAGTAIKPFERSARLVTVGPYRFTRNPMYLGMVTILVGVGVLFGSVGPLLVIPVFAYVIRRNFIDFEEAALEETFGAEYVTFKNRVRRWI